MPYHLKMKIIECLFQSIIPIVEIKDVNVLTGCKSSFNVPIKNKEETNEANTEMRKNNNYTTGNLFDYDYF